MIREKLAKLLYPEIWDINDGNKRSVETLSRRLATSYANENGSLDLLRNQQRVYEEELEGLRNAVQSAATAVSRHNVLLEALKRAIPYVRQAEAEMGAAVKKARSKAKKTAALAAQHAVTADLIFVGQAIKPDPVRDPEVAKTVNNARRAGGQPRVTNGQPAVAHAGA